MSFIEQVIGGIHDLIDDHWVKFLTGLALLAVGWVFGKWRARAQWKRREFLGRLNVSLNSIRPGEPLHIRTLLEKSCEEVFLNQLAVETITKAARQTTERDPILPLPKDDYWYYLNAVLNEIAEHFALGELKRDLGLPVSVRTYLICLTSEAAGDVRTRKLRAMLIAKDLLLALPEVPPPFERPWHHNRWTTLQFMAARYATHPEQFLEMELGV